METILQIHLDSEIVKKADYYAKKVNKTTTELVKEYLSHIAEDDNIAETHPITKRLTGVVKLDPNIDLDELLSEARLEQILEKVVH